MRDIDEAVVKFCEESYKDAVKYSKTYNGVMYWRGICYGAVQFVSNWGTDGKPLGDWWNNEMLEKFNNLAKEKRGRKA